MQTAKLEEAGAPAKVVVQSSGKDKLDGVYTRMTGTMPGLSSERPSYVKSVGKAPMYLYWAQSWKVGTEFGSTKSFATLADEPDRSDPCEPYPHTWKIFDSKSHKYTKAPGMRVVNPDAAAVTPRAKRRSPAGEASQGEASQGEASKPRKRGRPPKAEAPSEAGAPPKGAGRKRKAGTKAAGTKEAGAGATDEEASGSSSDSDSSSASSSSSSSSATQLKGPPPPRVVRGPPRSEAPRSEVSPLLKPQLAKAPISSQKQLDHFITDLRERLSKIPDTCEQQKKLHLVLESLQKKVDGEDTNGRMGPDMAKNAIDILKKEFVTVPNPSQRQWRSGVESPPAVLSHFLSSVKSDETKGWPWFKEPSVVPTL